MLFKKYLQVINVDFIDSQKKKSSSPVSINVINTPIIIDITIIKPVKVFSRFCICSAVLSAFVLFFNINRVIEN